MTGEQRCSADQSQPDDYDEESVRMSLFRMKKKHTQETRATKLTCNQTACPHFQQQHGCVGGATLCD